ncbi:hypothetical protein [Thalassotalea profundi]|nr:hypothetical protein [Thalassotalea profundi]
MLIMARRIERYFEVSEQIPCADEAEEFYQAHNGRMQLSIAGEV